MGPTGTGESNSWALLLHCMNSYWHLREIHGRYHVYHESGGISLTYNRQFIHLLTEDDRIRVGHDPESQTFDITTSTYEEPGITISLVDTAGFDDSREGVTDTDTLKRITDYLAEE
jgi:hypothetical protein